MTWMTRRNPLGLFVAPAIVCALLAATMLWAFTRPPPVLTQCPVYLPLATKGK